MPSQMSRSQAASTIQSGWRNSRSGGGYSQSRSALSAVTRADHTTPITQMCLQSTQAGTRSGVSRSASGMGSKSGYSQSASGGSSAFRTYVPSNHTSSGMMSSSGMTMSAGRTQSWAPVTASGVPPQGQVVLNNMPVVQPPKKSGCSCCCIAISVIGLIVAVIVGIGLWDHFCNSNTGTGGGGHSHHTSDDSDSSSAQRPGPKKPDPKKPDPKKPDPKKRRNGYMVSGAGLSRINGFYKQEGLSATGPKGFNVWVASTDFMGGEKKSFLNFIQAGSRKAIKPHYVNDKGCFIVHHLCVWYLVDPEKPGMPAYQAWHDSGKCPAKPPKRAAGATRFESAWGKWPGSDGTIPVVKKVGNP